MISFSKNSPITVVVADDYELILAGLKRLLEEDETIKVIGTAKNGKDALDMIVYYKPMVALLDIMMPELTGIEVTKFIKKSHPDIIAIMLTSLEDSQHFDEALEAGADGYLYKEICSKELREAISMAVLGERVFSKKFIKYLNNYKTFHEDIETPSISFTRREQDIIKMLLNEKTNLEIALELALSVRTVETHKLNIMRKLDVKNSLALDKILRKIYAAKSC